MSTSSVLTDGLLFGPLITNGLGYNGPTDGSSFISTGVSAEYCQVPTAKVVADPSFGVIGSVVKLDGRLSEDPDGLSLTYIWEFVSVPIGSTVGQEGFRALDEESSQVSFSPDVVGEYVIGLTVSNGTLDSTRAVTKTSIRAIMVPHGRGIVPDGKFIWSYIRDVWTQVEGKEIFETFWSALIQIVGSEMLKLYQVDFNKSIRDVQDLYQRRWMSYEPKLALKSEDLSFYLGNHRAGNNAVTGPVNLGGSVVILGQLGMAVIEGSITPNLTSVEILHSLDSNNVGSYNISSLNSSKSGYSLVSGTVIPGPNADKLLSNVSFYFDINSTNWEGDASTGWDPSVVQVGDVIHYRAGPNSGFHRITSIDGNNITVSTAPAGSSDTSSSALYTANVYRPVPVEFKFKAQSASDVVAVPQSSETIELSTLAPGRVIVAGGQAYTVQRASLDPAQRVPLVVLGVDGQKLPSGVMGMNWRVPHTLVSETQNFEELGVSSGDLLLFDLVHPSSQRSVELKAQVVGVDRYRLGFVLTDGSVKAGTVPDVPNDVYTSISEAIGIAGVTEGRDGSISFSSTAKTLKDALDSGIFQSSYWNTELTPDSEIKVKGFTFKLKPKSIIRNRLVPVGTDLRSVPLLQEFIVQPTVVERDGKFYQLRNGQEYELKNKPAILIENADFLIDGETVFEGEMTFKTGSSALSVDDGDFLDRSVSIGDSFIIKTPSSVAGTYKIMSIPGRHSLVLDTTIPESGVDGMVTADVVIKRKRSGQFLRFVPGLFSAKNPAPNRLWAEVSFFDNSESIENNFGILVGLKRSDLEKISSDLNYRQAVAGLMFAYTRGSSIDKVRLGAQILLGLPFAEHRAIIRSIEEDYRLDIEGNPIQGRVLAEDVDFSGTALGTLRSYLFPIEEGSDLSGLDINPATGETYKVGDVLELFSPISKGVEVSDYLTRPLDSFHSVKARLQQLHSIRVRINDDIFTPDEISLVSSFLKKITPSYIATILTISSEMVDDVNIQDSVSIASTLKLFENTSLKMDSTVMVDSKSPDGVPQIWLDGKVYSVRRYGSDLSLSDASSTCTTASGGVLSPKSNEEFQGPLTKEGDVLLVLDGPYAGSYTITTGLTDTVIPVSDGPAMGFSEGSGYRFAILREQNGLLLEGSATFDAAGSSATITGAALRTDGATPGDWIITKDPAIGYRMIISEVLESVPGSGIWDKVSVVPAPKLSGTTDYQIVRPSALKSDILQFSITTDSSEYFTSTDFIHGYAEVGDELEFLDGSLKGRRYPIIDSVNLGVASTAFGIPATYNVKLLKKDLGDALLLETRQFFNPRDIVEIALVDSATTASVTSGSTEVVFTGFNPADELLIRPGDMLQITSGTPASTNVGYGPGLYPIKSVTDDSVVISFETGTTFTTSASVSWKLIRKR